MDLRQLLQPLELSLYDSFLSLISFPLMNYNIVFEAMRWVRYTKHSHVKYVIYGAVIMSYQKCYQTITKTFSYFMTIPLKASNTYIKFFILKKDFYYQSNIAFQITSGPCLLSFFLPLMVKTEISPS